MKIYAFTEVYPSPYKSYHDTQFEQFIEDGHQLSIFSFGRHSGELNATDRRLSLHKRVVRLAATIRDVPRVSVPVMGRALSSPIATARKLRAATNYSTATKWRLLNSVHAVMLPEETPDLCIVHNLVTQIRLEILRSVYPAAVIVFYYHGGELPGVPAVSDRDAARAFASADIVFTNTSNSRQHAIARSCPPEKIFVSPVGFNLREYPALRNRTYRGNGQLRVLTVGRLSEEKGIMYALEALLQLQRNGTKCRFRIVGDGPQESQLRSYVAEHALGDSVEFLGRLSREPLNREYASTDVLLLPSVAQGTWQETQACVVQEALLANVVAAVSRTGGVPESTAPDMLRFSFEPRDSAQIARAVSEIDRLPIEELKALGDAGRRFVQSRYDICKVNRQLLDVTAKVTGRNWGQT